MEQFYGGVVAIVGGLLGIIFKKPLTKVRMLHGEYWPQHYFFWIGIVAIVCGIVFISLFKMGIIL